MTSMSQQWGNMVHVVILGIYSINLLCAYGNQENLIS